MNEYREALDRVAFNFGLDCLDEALEQEEQDNLAHDISVLNELVERATPKKAILVNDYRGLVFECPNCHMEFRPTTVLGEVDWKGCPYCLQRLDFRSEEE